jgi:hypothetical protein
MTDSALLPTPAPIREIAGLTPSDLTEALLTSTTPFVARGLAAGWPYVQAALTSQQAASAYLCRFYTGEPVVAYVGPPEIRGRFAYSDDLTRMNFAAINARLDLILAQLAEHAHDTQPPYCYVGSTSIDRYLPGFQAENDLPLGERHPMTSIWLGNQTRVAAHFDFSDNLAVVAAGRRKFTLFPPEQLSNLYIGPLDFTPAGQSISMVDFDQPDLDKYPRFAQAMRHAQEAVLTPGDAIFIPTMWWHHVAGLEAFNTLINYWWRQTPHYLGTPSTTLLDAMLTIRALPPEQRRAWQEHFRHYVFESDGQEAAHIPEGARRVLAPFDADSAQALRAQLAKRLR